MSESVNELITESTTVATELNKFILNTKKHGVANYTVTYLQNRLVSANKKYESARKLNARIVNLAKPEAKEKLAYFTENLFDAIITKFEEIEEYLENEIDKIQQANNQIGEVLNTSMVAAHDNVHVAYTRLPELTPPSFSGIYTEWMPFKDQFEAVIHNRMDMPAIRKFQYLRSCLTGEAKAAIQSFTLTAENYETAWKLLIDTYQNERLIISKLLSLITDIRPVSYENLKGLKYMKNTVQVATSTLASLECNISDQMLIHLLINKFDDTLRAKWESKISDSNKYPEFKVLEKFISDRIQALESINSTVNKQAKFKSNANVKSHNASIKESPCAVCNQNHKVTACPKFNSMSNEDKLKTVREKRLCLNCLRANHFVSLCQSTYRCLKCHRSHHTILHDACTAEYQQKNPEKHSFSSNQLSNVVTSNKDSEEAIVNVGTTSGGTKLLATAVAKLRAHDGRCVFANILIDPGSEISFITERMTQLLRLKKEPISVTISGIGNSHKQVANHATRVDLLASNENSKDVNLVAIILKSVTNYTPKNFDLNEFPQLKNVRLASSTEISRKDIDVLIGVDFLPRILTGDTLISDDKQLIAQSTIFGWVVSGQTQSRDLNSHVSVNHCCEFEKTIQKFWEIENIPESHLASGEDDYCENLFKQTTYQTDTGRYVVKLPFKSNEALNSLGESRRIAELSLERIEKRFEKNPLLKQTYIEFMNEYETLGHLKEISFEQANQKNRIFVPHHPVFKLTDGKPKLRVVFNASAKTSSGVSLNDTLYAGPKLQTDIESILMNWRTFPFVFSTDMVKMYRQILVDKEDRVRQNIVWRDFENQKFRYLELQTLTYGETPAPFLAIRTVHEISEKCKEKHPVISNLLKKNVFVDDIFGGATNEKDLLELRTELVQVLREAKIELSKWLSNSAKFATQNSEIKQIEELENTPKILGIFWDPKNDEFSVSHDIPTDVKLTKRTIASTIAKTYDPAGWVSPVTVRFKHFLQQLWLSKIDWDSPVPPQMLNDWQSLCEELKNLDQIKIPRWFKTDEKSKIDLIGFCDSSSLSYSCVLYLRVTQPDGQVHVSNVMAKTRVAPIKTLSIPRLELSAAVLLAKLTRYFNRHFQGKIDETFLFTDSKIVLAWLAKHPSTWSVFIANRVSEIHTNLPSNAKWSHVISKENPADLNSRGITVNALVNSKLWWEGPDFLKSKIIVKNEFATSIEQRKVSFSHITTDEIEEEPFMKFSSYSKMIRVYSYVFRFVNVTRHQSKAPDSLALTLDEIDQAKTCIIKRVQRLAFSKEIRELTILKLSSNSKLLPLSPFLDESGILRVGGRLQNAHMSFSQKHPIIIPKGEFAEKLIYHFHLRGVHSGIQLTLTSLRQEFWVINARNITRKVIHSCVFCKRERHEMSHQYMASLPESRTTRAPAFEHTGVDFMGHFFIHDRVGRGAQKIKVWVAVFVCMVTRATHLELCGSLTTDSFLAALERFMCRRGNVVCYYSDNGTNLKGGNNVLKRLFNTATRDPDMQNSLRTQGINWYFIPEAAPHQGCWERTVRSVKNHLRPSMRNLIFTREEMETILCRIESCLNSRPMYKRSDDISDLDYLSPGHFLIGVPLNLPPQKTTLNLKENRLSRWQKVQRVEEIFWKRWSLEYLTTLQSRQKWREKVKNVKVGDIVLIRKPNLPPRKWLLGRVMKTHLGENDVVRVVELRTATGSLTRPVTQICPLVESE